jgi:acetylornithine aminotransferase/acetylornithine/N-succinyldiaminopimelate aminotransferase
MTLDNVQQLDRDHVAHTYDRYPVLLVSGNGVHVTDSEGNHFLDFLSGIGVNALGYGHPAVTSAVIKQLQTGLLHTSNLFHNEHQAELAHKLCAISGMQKAFIANTGTEAWEGALKFARLHALAKAPGDGQKRTRIIAMHNSFHGRTYGSLSTTGQAKYRDPFAPLVPDVDFVKFNDVADLMRKVDGSIAAICLETIQGEGGVVPVTPEFFRAARELSDSVGAVLICDEIQCGMGRTGKWFAYQHYGIQPDIVTLAKPVAGGVPLAAILMTEAVAAAIKPGMHGTTFGGGPLACAAALAAIEAIEQEKLLHHVNQVGSYFAQKLTALAHDLDCIKDVRGMGLMVAVELHSADIAKRAVTDMLARKIIINRTHETVLRFLPPYIIGTQHVDELITALAHVLKVASAASTISVGGQEKKHG